MIWGPAIWNKNNPYKIKISQPKTIHYNNSIEEYPTDSMVEIQF